MLVWCFAENLDSNYVDESDDMADEGFQGPERTYRGPHITFPLEKKDIHTLIDLFRKKKVGREFGDKVVIVCFWKRLCRNLHQNLDKTLLSIRRMEL